MLWKRFGALAICLVAGTVLWNVAPFDSSLTSTAMHMLAVFIAVILSLLLTDYPISVSAGIGLCMLAVTKNLQCETGGIAHECSRCLSDTICDASRNSLEAALAGFADEVNWLVFAAFQIGRAVELTRVGERLSLLLIKFVGRSVLGLGYAVFLAEVVLAPFVPSNTARAGGIITPIIVSVARTLGSTPDHQPRANGGEFLILCGAHANLISASLYQTGMAANPFVSQKAFEVFGIDFGYMVWLCGSAVPSLLLVLLCPLLIYRLSFWKKREARSEGEEAVTLLDEEIETGPTDLLRDIRAQVSEELARMGQLSVKEWKLVAVLLLCLSLWLSKSFHGIDTSLVALCAVMLLIVLDIITWKDVLHNEKAWDTFFWLGILIMMAGQLRLLGIADFIGTAVSNVVILANLSTVGSSILLAAMYFMSMYLFSSLTGHLLALVGPFLVAGKSLGCPPYLLTALLAYFSSLSGCVTNYSSGPIVIYYSQDYVKRLRWFGLGFLVGLLHVVVYSSVGLLWWKILGWW